MAVSPWSAVQRKKSLKKFQSEIITKALKMKSQINGSPEIKSTSSPKE